MSFYALIPTQGRKRRSFCNPHVLVTHPPPGHAPASLQANRIYYYRSSSSSTFRPRLFDSHSSTSSRKPATRSGRITATKPAKDNEQKVWNRFLVETYGVHQHWYAQLHRLQQRQCHLRHRTIVSTTTHPDLSDVRLTTSTTNFCTTASMHPCLIQQRLLRFTFLHRGCDTRTPIAHRPYLRHRRYIVAVREQTS